MKMTRLFAAFLLCASGCTPEEQRSTTTKEEVDAMVRREVPVGSSTSQVIAFLDSEKIERSDYRETDKVILAIVRDASRAAVTKGNIQIEFRFDDAAHLREHVVREVFTGP
jgi:hypothetical protein